MLRDRWQRFRTVAPLLLLVAAAACNDDPGLLPGGRSAPAHPALAASTQCKSSGMVRGPSDVNGDLNDFARALYDADESGILACVDSAAAIMTVKLNATLNARPWHFGKSCPANEPGCGFNAGAIVALIFSAADRITAKGGMTAALDSALRRVEDAYAYNETADGCALQSTDNCMDGHSAAASGYGWIAAYRYLRGDPAASVEDARASTRLHVAETFSSACIFKGYGYADLCKTPATAVQATDNTMAFNLGHEHIAYGFGLMTSIAAGVLGYEVTGVSYPFQAHEKTIAVLLFAEAQRAVIGTDVFRKTCPYVQKVNGLWAAAGDSAWCGGKEGYQPQMYALKKFYETRIQQVPSAGTYMSDVFNEALFPKESVPTGFFSWGRFETYGRLGYDWYVHPRSHQRFVDAYAPHGWVDGIDASRYLSGWACDRDVPSGSVRVTIKAPGKAAITQRAEQASEAGIATQCGGGYAHRFAILLPADWTGLTVSATVMDYFGFRSAPLGCSGCVVPSVTVEWLQPSGVTWGPPNTLTAAGLARNGQGTVKLEWRDVTFSTPSFTVEPYQAPVDAYGQWSNTVPSSNYCHNFEVRATYNAVTSRTFTYRGITSGFCNESARVIWIQPQTMTGWGTPGALIVAGEAKGAPSGATVTMWWRNVSTNGPWVKAPYAAPTDANGIWINDIPNANYLQQYAVYGKYDVITTSTCTYAGNNNITWC
jgi:hypothetical protein